MCEQVFTAHDIVYMYVCRYVLRKRPRPNFNNQFTPALHIHFHTFYRHNVTPRICYKKEDIENGAGYYPLFATASNTVQQLEKLTNDRQFWKTFLTFSIKIKNRSSLCKKRRVIKSKNC